MKDYYKIQSGLTSRIKEIKRRISRFLNGRTISNMTKDEWEQAHKLGEDDYLCLTTWVNRNADNF